MAGSELLGMAVCPDCGTRFGVREASRHRIGKPARCARCLSHFMVTLQPARSAGGHPLPPEASDLPLREQPGDEHHAVDVIRRSLLALHPILSELYAAGDCPLEDLRGWCRRVFSMALGYRLDEIGEGAYAAPADYVLTYAQKAVAAVAVCGVFADLLEGRDRAVQAAFRLSVDWVVVTNGHLWRLYRLARSPRKPTRVLEVFDLALLDEDGVSRDDAGKLRLLTAKAIITGETEALHRKVALQNPKLLRRLSEITLAGNSARIAGAVGFLESLETGPNQQTLGSQVADAAMDSALDVLINLAGEILSHVDIGS